MLHEVQKYETSQQEEKEQAEASDEFTRKLSVLTTAELEMLEKLHNKIHDQSNEIIIPDSKKFGDSVGYEKTRTEPLTRTRNSSKHSRTK